MSDLTCCICDELYDLEDHLPLLAPCALHHFCISCIKLSLSLNKSFTCTYHNQIFTIPISAYLECKDITAFIKENQIRCFYDESPAFTFDNSLKIALCKTHSLEIQGLPITSSKVQNPMTLRESVILTLIETFLMNKAKISFEFKRLFALLLSKKNLQALLSYLNALKAYVDPNLNLVRNCKIDQNFVLDPTNFQIFYKHEEFKTQENWDSFIREKINSLKNKQIWYFTDVFKYICSKGLNELRILIEIEYMTKNIITKITDLSCPSCGKGFQLGSRYPRKSQNCGHLVCYFCSLTTEGCRYCGVAYGKLESKVYSELFEDVNCKLCIKSTPISFENLPYHSFCDCIYCENCIKKDCLTQCKTCINVSTFSTENFFKISKKTLIRSYYMSINLCCMACNIQNSIFFSKKQHILLCNQCFKGYSAPERVSLECQRLDIIEKLEEYIQATFYISFHQNFPNFAYYPINRKLMIILQSLNKEFRVNGPNYCFFDTKIYKRFKTIYPVNSNDRRALKTDNNEKFEVMLKTNRTVHIFSVIVGGSSYIVGPSLRVTVSINNIYTIKNFTGKEGYIMLNEMVSGLEFHITIAYASTCSVATGKYLKNPSASSSQVSFSFTNLNSHSRVDNSRCGPILGVIYSDDV